MNLRFFTSWLACALGVLVWGCGTVLAAEKPGTQIVTVAGVVPAVIRVELGRDVASATPIPASLSSRDLQQAIAAVIDNSDVKVQVLALQRGQKPTIFLSGKVSDAVQENARSAAKQFVPEFAFALKEHFEAEPGTPATPPLPETEVWPLTFVDSTLRDAESDQQYEVAQMVKALNALYGSKNGDEPIQVARNMLVLHGSEDTLRNIKRQLVLLDAPGPQVQLDLWAIQISGKRGKEYSEVLSEIADDVRATQNVMRAVPGLIKFEKSDFDSKITSAETQAALNDLNELGFDTNPVRHMSLNEKFIFLGLADKNVRDRILNNAKAELDKGDNLPGRLWRANQAKKLKRQRDYKTGDATLRYLRGTFSTSDDALLRDAELKRDQGAIANFARSAVAFNNNQANAAAKVKVDAAPLNLRARAATADALFKAATDAFTQDMQGMFLEPLLRRIVEKQRSGSIKGVSLVGRSRLVVTSGLATSLKPELASYINTTRTVPLSTEVLDQAFPGNGTADTSGSENALSGVASELSQLPTAQAVALVAALNPPKPTYTRVAPGVGIEVRPSVLPDGGSARLQVKMSFGVETTAFEGDESDKSGLSYPTADAVKSHQVTTDAIVGAFDLFDISSFDISTSYPRPPGSVPILGTLPLIGPAFQWRRKATALEHHSLILVNTVILPRALNLTQFYSGNP